MLVWYAVLFLRLFLVCYSIIVCPLDMRLSINLELAIPDSMYSNGEKKKGEEEEVPWINGGICVFLGSEKLRSQ